MRRRDSQAVEIHYGERPATIKPEGSCSRSIFVIHTLLFVKEEKRCVGTRSSR
jgi:hypothetical protein